jgi:hypothetical protein
VLTDLTGVEGSSFGVRTRRSKEFKEFSCARLYRDADALRSAISSSGLIFDLRSADPNRGGCKVYQILVII